MLIGKIFPVFVVSASKGSNIFLWKDLEHVPEKSKKTSVWLQNFWKFQAFFQMLFSIFFVTQCTIISWEMCDRALVRKFLTLNYSVALATFFVMFNIVVCNFVNFAGNDIQRPTRSHWKQRQVPMTTTQVEC